MAGNVRVLVVLLFSVVVVFGHLIILFPFSSCPDMLKEGNGTRTKLTSPLSD